MHDIKPDIDNNPYNSINLIDAIRQNLQKGTHSIGAWQMTADINITCAMASLGFDWIVVDLEHTTINLNEVQAIIIAAERYKVAPFVRLPNCDPYFARRLLDVGAQGLLIPVVEDANELTNFVKHCFYPPEGSRGLGLTRVNMWGKQLDSYINKFRPFIVPQIETVTGVEKLDKIVQVKGVDAIFIGPYDLSTNLGIQGQLQHPRMLEALKKVKIVCSNAKMPIGIHQVHPDPECLKEHIKDGFSFIAYGTDTISIQHALNGFRSI